MRMRKWRWVALVCFCVLALALPCAAVAAEERDVPYLDENGRQRTAASTTRVEGSGEPPVTWAAGWYVARGPVTIEKHVEIQGNVHLILADGAALTIGQGVWLDAPNSLTIYAQSTGSAMGKLVSDATYGAGAGIGASAYDEDAGTVTINGGYVEATGSRWAAGIGGYGRKGGAVTINGGHVKAQGGEQAAGIGGGYSESSTTGSSITINGGFVEAAGGPGGDGIGYGDIEGVGGSLTVNGDAVVFAQKGSSANKDLNGDSVTLTQGVVFTSGDGTVYGAPSLPGDLRIEDLTIPEGATLTIPSGATLTIPQYECLTNKGVLINEGTLVNQGTLDNTNGSIINNGTYSDAGGARIERADRTITIPGTASVTKDSVTLQAADIDKGPGDGEVVYAVSPVDAAPSSSSSWQESVIFNGLSEDTPYYFFARVRMGDFHKEATSKGYAVTISAPVITTGSLQGGVVGKAYDQQLAATGTPPITWSIVADSGSLPGGLALDEDSGVISGKPTAKGQYRFTVQAVNGAGRDTRALTIDVSAAPVPPSITTGSLPRGVVDTEYHAELAATGDTPITWSIVADSGSLPAGLALDEDSGEISGTPEAAGQYRFTVQAVNGAGTATKPLTINVDAAPVSPTPITPITILTQPSDQTVQAGQAATFRLRATGDGLRYQWQTDRGDGKGWTAVPGATADSYTTPAAGAGDDGCRYRCRLADSNGGTAFSDAATLHVTPAPAPSPTPIAPPPKTGDSARPVLWTLLALLGAAGAALLLRRMRR